MVPPPRPSPAAQGRELSVTVMRGMITASSVGRGGSPPLPSLATRQTGSDYILVRGSSFPRERGKVGMGELKLVQN